MESNSTTNSTTKSTTDNNTSSNLAQQAAAAGQCIAEEKFWLNQFSGTLEKTIFPYDYTGGKAGERRMENLTFQLKDTLAAKMTKISGQSDFRLYMIQVAGILQLLYRYSGSTDITVGTPVLKQETDAEFINTVLPLRNRFSADITFKQSILNVRQTIVEATENQNYPIETLLFQLDMSLSEPEFPLFDIAVLLESIHDKKYLDHIKYNMLCSFRSVDDGMQLQWRYNAARYKPETVKRIYRHFENIMDTALTDVNTGITGLDCIDQEERDRLLHRFNNIDENDTAPNNTALNITEKTPIHDLFSRQVEQNPDRIAVVDTAKELFVTYRELDRRAGEIAARLQRQGMQTGMIAAVMQQRSIEMVTAILGVLKTGGIYLPIDSNYPEERIRFMLADSGARILIAPLETDAYEHVTVISANSHNTSGEELETVDTVGMNDYLYAVYTSGSTGKPKGVLVTHDNFYNLIQAHRRVFDEGPDDRMSQAANPSFDAMAFELWPALTAGAALYIVDDNTQVDPRRMKEWLIKNRITITYQPTIFAETLIFEDWPENTALRAMRTAGEQLVHTPPKGLPYRFYNLYGPTECTVWSTYSQVKPGTDTGRLPDIGTPVANHRIYITDKNQNLQPVGVAGEMCIAGAGTAAGYLNRPELTAQQFIRNHIDNGILYKTGDRARWLPEGVIEFLGRIDQQVKIRGFRVELGEIENRLQQHESVSAAVVVVKEPETAEHDIRDRFLCAYYESEDELTVSELREHLSRQLPDYMLPTFFIRLESIPLTASGKVDKKALPEPQAKSGAEYEAPTTDIEEKLAEAWQEVLAIEQVGVNDNFFEMGGDSVKSIQISAALQKHGLRVEIRDIFMYSTIKELANSVKPIDRIIDQGPVEGEIKTTPIINWLFTNFKNDLHHCNQSVMLNRPDGYDAANLQQVFQKIVEHHDALRMVCRFDDGAVTLCNRGLETEPFEIDVYNFEDEAEPAARITEEAEKLQRSIDLQQGPLMRVGHFKTKEEDHLLIILHHLVADGLTWRILMEDLEIGLSQAEKGEPIQFQAKTDSFKHWAEAVDQYARGSELLREIDYWKAIEETPSSTLPEDTPLPPEQNRFKNTATVVTQLDEKSSESLLKEAHHAYNTEITDILMTALGLAFKDWAGIESIAVNLEGHGREEFLENVNINRTIGWFTALYPVILDMSQYAELSYQVKHIKETLRRVPNKGIGYGILKYLTPQEKRNGLQFNLKPRVSFNYFGQLGQSETAMSPINSGQNVSPDMERHADIEINGAVTNNRLYISFAYNKHQFQKETIQKLSDSYKTNLESLILHCSQKQDQEITPSDVEYTEISIGDLEKIQDFLVENL